MDKADRLSRWDKTKKRLENLRGALQSYESMPPDEAKRIMDERARLLAMIPSEVDAGDESELILFMLGSQLFGVETRIVREVFQLSHFVPVPGVPDFYVGVTNLRGEVLAVIDIRQFFGINEKSDVDPWIIVLGRDQPEFGFIADSIDTVKKVATDEFADVPASVLDRGSEYSKGITGDCVIVLNSETLLNDDRLYVDQE